MPEELTMLAAIRQQGEGCASLGSPLYATLLDGMATDFEAGGVIHRLLADRPRPQRDAVPLRLLGATHRLALTGRAPSLARHFPSCGGIPGTTVSADHLAVVDEHAGYIEAQLAGQVQTNEIGRTAALVIGFALLARRFGLPLRTFEVGASAGLISRWHRYAFDAGATACGDPGSSVRFTDNWTAPPDLSGAPTVVERSACDIAPLDAASPEDRLRLLSFVWPDQAQRFTRLEAALQIAAGDPLPIDVRRAADWVGERVDVAVGTTTVLFHTIVWQYLMPEDRDALRARLAEAGRRATVRSPLAWMRMEPAGQRADVRLTTWPGGAEEVLATTGYHGADVTPTRCAPSRHDRTR